MATVKNLLSAMIDKINAAPKTVNGIAPDVNGNIEVAGGGTSNEETIYVFLRQNENFETVIVESSEDFPTYNELLEMFNNHKIPNIIYIYDDGFNRTQTLKETLIEYDVSKEFFPIDHFRLNISQPLYVTAEDGLLTETEMNNKYYVSME